MTAPGRRPWINAGAPDRLNADAGLEEGLFTAATRGGWFVRNGRNPAMTEHAEFAAVVPPPE